jgi:hypothetical protein
MLGMRPFNPGPGRLRVDVEGDGDDFQTLRVKLSPQCLPDWQVESASSP